MITILFSIWGLWVLVSIADFIRAILWQRQLKKQQVRADFRHVEMLEAYAKIEECFKVETVALNSVKRHIRSLLEGLEKHEQKLDEAVKVEK